MTILYMFLKVGRLRVLGLEPLVVHCGLVVFVEQLPQLLLFYAHLNSLGGIDAAKDSSSGKSGGSLVRRPGRCASFDMPPCIVCLTGGPASGGHYTDFDEGAPSSYQDSSYDNKPYTAPSGTHRVSFAACGLALFAHCACSTLLHQMMCEGVERRQGCVVVLAIVTVCVWIARFGNSSARSAPLPRRRLSSHAPPQNHKNTQHFLF